MLINLYCIVVNGAYFIWVFSVCQITCFHAEPKYILFKNSVDADQLTADQDQTFFHYNFTLKNMSILIYEILIKFKSDRVNTGPVDMYTALASGALGSMPVKLGH